MHEHYEKRGKFYLFLQKVDQITYGDFNKHILEIVAVVRLKQVFNQQHWHNIKDLS